MFESALSGGPFSANGVPVSSFGSFIGPVLLADGSTCGTANEFFGVISTAKASALDPSGAVLWGRCPRARMVLSSCRCSAMERRSPFNAKALRPFL